MTNTTYTDPCGLKETTVSTAAGPAQAGQGGHAERRVPRDRRHAAASTIPGIDRTDLQQQRRCLLEPGVSGIKTGSSTPAGGNLLWAADTIVDGKSRRSSAR